MKAAPDPVARPGTRTGATIGARQAVRPMKAFAPDLLRTFGKTMRMRETMEIVSRKINRQLGDWPTLAPLARSALAEFS
ncbi:hypothetical protein [Azospirillum sp.]|uniref:hypothetical protein n=1 Tax=Azospirillum sp. TaxID=34012 RepID=UPI002D383B2C|nr:hypothetical protein [Azospirillum sp.]HYD71068.1 hypothetical protein [Azospirillum sp.]